MALDRRIQVVVESPGGFDNDGNPLPPVVVAHEVWATRFDQSLEQVISEGGQRNETRRSFRIRWSSAIAGQPPTSLSIVDGGISLDVVNIIEETSRGRSRHKWLRLEATVST